MPAIAAPPELGGDNNPEEDKRRVTESSDFTELQSGWPVAAPSVGFDELSVQRKSGMK